jgi:hypothetical protein
LLGSGVGLLFGVSMDEKEVTDKARLLEKASECLADGETAPLIVAKEDEPALETMLKDFQIAIIRMDAAKIASEIESTEKRAQLKAAARELQKKQP